MKRGFLVALLVLATPVALARATAPDALAAVDACIPRLDVELDVGYERIAARCPDLTRALAQLQCRGHEQRYQRTRAVQRPPQRTASAEGLQRPTARDKVDVRQLPRNR